MEVVIVTSSKDAGGGVAVLDLKTCTPVCGNFKNSVADAGGTVCVVGAGPSSFAGVGSCGDYVTVAQSKKPTVHIYQWGRPQALHQCHLQEILTTVASDALGRYVAGGSKTGWLYLWELGTGALVNAWQAHFKSVTRLQFTRCGDYLLSAAEDGMARAWEVVHFVDTSTYSASAASSSTSSSSSSGAASRKSVAPYRSWSPHTLAARDMCVIGGLGGPTLRVMTCSLDRTVVLFDVHACPPSGKQVVRMSLGGPLESVACRPAGDLAFAGSSGGAIYVVDLSAAAAGISAAANADAGAARVLEGHTRAVTALACSLDNVTLVSASEDGSLRVWDMVTRQCLREVQPLNKTALTNCIVRSCALRAVLTTLLYFNSCCVSHRSPYVRNLSGSGPPCTSRRCAR